MEAKPAKAGLTAPECVLELADKQINALIERHLPETPHILSVPTGNPYLPSFPYENQNTPFEDWEVKPLQYMTLVSSGDRGVGFAQGNWQEEFNARSPWSAEARSSTSTPNPSKDLKKPAVKMSITDYKNLKQTGVKPAPTSFAGSPEPQPRHDMADSRPTDSKTTSSGSADTSIARVPSIEGLVNVQKSKASGNVQATRSEHKESSRDDERSGPPRATSTETRPGDKVQLAANGHIDRPQHDLLRPKDTNTNPRLPARPDHLHHIKHALPPRPPSPQQSTPNLKQPKRALESGDTSYPEKRTKINHTNPRTPSSSQKAIPRKPEPTPPESRPLPSKPPKPSGSGLQATAPGVSPKPTKWASPNPKPIETKTTYKSKASDSDKSLNTLPPLLSPLPPDLTSPNAQSLSTPSGFGNTNWSEPERVATPKPLSKPAAIAEDTIVVKRPNTKSDHPPQSSPLSPRPKSSSPPFVLPRLLSPDLPDIVEQELLRLQQKSTALNTVEARHEKARQPDAPGVARKTVRPKVGHPPPRHRASDSTSSAQKSQDFVETAESAATDKRIVVLSYKRRLAKDMERLLATKPKLSKEFKRAEAERLARLSSNSGMALSKVEASDSQEDVPLSTLNSKAPGKKRAIDIPERRTEPAAKRAKGPENLDISKSHPPVPPAFKSPALTAPNQKSMLATPKKGDAMKSVAMRKVDSNDGHARTPQATSTSTPASAEKPRVNGHGDNRTVDMEQLRAEDTKYTHLALKLKRKMDGILKTKELKLEPISESDRKLGLCVGLESLVAYMKSFHAHERRQRIRDPSNWESWIALWSFIDRLSQPFQGLQALAIQLGGICREELNKIYTDKIYAEAKDQKSSEAATDTKLYDKWCSNSKARDAIWIQAQRTRQHLIDLGSNEILGPWTSITDATNYAMTVLAAYDEKEGVGWKADNDF